MLLRRLRPEVLQDIVRNGVFYKFASRRYPGGGSFAAVQCDNCQCAGIGNMLGLGRSLDLCLRCAVKAVTRAQNCIGCPVAEAAEYVRNNSVFEVSENTARWNSIRLVASEDGVVTGAVSVYEASFATAEDPEPHAPAEDVEEDDVYEDDDLRYTYEDNPDSDTNDNDDDGDDGDIAVIGGGHFFAQFTVTVDAQGNPLINGVPVSQLPQDSSDEDASDDTGNEGGDEDGDENDVEDNAVQQPQT